jgi:hypothetical protein
LGYLGEVCTQVKPQAMIQDGLAESWLAVPPILHDRHRSKNMQRE